MREDSLSAKQEPSGLRLDDIERMEALEPEATRLARLAENSKYGTDEWELKDALLMDDYMVMVMSNAKELLRLARKALEFQEEL